MRSIDEVETEQKFRSDNSNTSANGKPKWLNISRRK